MHIKQEYVRPVRSVSPIFKSMGIDNQGKEFVLKVAMFVSTDILRLKKYY